MKRRQFTEPLTINGSVVAKHLEDLGCPEMAAFVRRLDTSARESNRRDAEWRQRWRDLVERLRKYEPLEEHETVTYRSEWD